MGSKGFRGAVCDRDEFFGVWGRGGSEGRVQEQEGEAVDDACEGLVITQELDCGKTVEHSSHAFFHIGVVGARIRGKVDVFLGEAVVIGIESMRVSGDDPAIQDHFHEDMGCEAGVSNALPGGLELGCEPLHLLAEPRQGMKTSIGLEMASNPVGQLFAFHIVGGVQIALDNQGKRAFFEQRPQIGQS